MRESWEKVLREVERKSCESEKVERVVGQSSVNERELVHVTQQKLEEGIFIAFWNFDFCQKASWKKAIPHGTFALKASFLIKAEKKGKKSLSKYGLSQLWKAPNGKL